MSNKTQQQYWILNDNNRDNRLMYIGKMGTKSLAKIAHDSYWGCSCLAHLVQWDTIRIGSICVGLQLTAKVSSIKYRCQTKLLNSIEIWTITIDNEGSCSLVKFAQKLLQKIAQDSYRGWTCLAHLVQWDTIRIGSVCVEFLMAVKVSNLREKMMEKKDILN